ncbi:hypothetical protein SB2_12125 [Methylobacterium radiotolerans]|nr:hypothetical protein SB3_06770 [Methylobacterium radiotolerans]KTS47928.1 hypothetical protein SB2_12125 [Methylobacterium radiotolerans]
MIEKRVGLAQREHDRADRSSAALFPAVANFAVEALKAAALVNGGSAAAMLAFIGTGRQPVTLDTILGLKLFGVGLLIAAAASGFAYLAQFSYVVAMQKLTYTWDHPFVVETPASKWANRAAVAFHLVGVACVAVAYGCAVAGLLYVAGGLVPLPAKV